MKDSQADETKPSKSQRKQKMLFLQDLGTTLVNLSREQLSHLPLEEKLLTAVLHAQSISSRGALRRQLQYIGRLMRECDAEPIEKALSALQFQDKQEIALLHRLERWRDRLIAEGDDALSELMKSFPGADRQYLRQLIRNAQLELKNQKPPKSSRLIFRYLREQGSN